MTSIKHKLVYLAASTIPIYLWAKLVQHYLNYKRQLIEKKKAHNKNNCVVVYAKEAGMSGWPDYPERLALTLDSYSKFLEPVLHFIDTTKSRLDVSVMIITNQTVINCLANAADRGVTIRIILDSKYEDMKKTMKKLVKKGVLIIYEQKLLNVDTIMHHKYAVKDFNIADGSGFALCGSLNWTQSAFAENYECLVFSTNKQVVGAFNKNFKETWEFLHKMQETNMLSETMYPV